jgi:hypothetical protein
MAKKSFRSSANDVTAPDAPATARPRARAAKLNSTASGPERISDALPQQDAGLPEPGRIQQTPGDAIAARLQDGPTDEDIRARAYEMYLERGAQHGLDFDDWVRAERELRRKP